MLISCGENFLVDGETREISPYGGGCSGDYSLRSEVCVRDSDQCPRSLILSNDSCSLLPCNNSLYFDGRYCVSSSAFAPSSFQDPVPTPIDSFSTLCLKPDWTTEQTLTNLGLIYLGLDNAGLLSEDNFSLTADNTTCAITRSYIFDSQVEEVTFPFKGLSDLTPLQAFEYATNIKDLYIEVSRDTLMSCPLTDTAVCKFIPFTNGEL
jgi:hypothetical protein